ncbi:hypothetical protein TrLO_g9321 [Triparma laevis f. longispina]|uniref:Uncharacterized protein n=1 Tax=Triparma laevis f. longispina TaxID=1714387 RepID=A0A9W6ZP10_9STRA|nr:hypothetical protein TrLO_g9321 [Triparma laevis f. longispina]
MSLEKSPQLRRRIIFATTQIILTLPTIIPAMAPPDYVKEALKAVNFLNIDLFNMRFVVIAGSSLEETQ